MAANTENGGRRNSIPWRIIGWGSAALILLGHFVAMQFTSEVNWSPFDFVFAGGLMGAVGIGLELAARKGNASYRTAAGVALVGMFLLVWINGAVGIIGGEDEAANILFLGVLIVGVAGAVIARFRAAGMVWAMAATALALALVPVLASAWWPRSMEAVWSAKTLMLVGFLGALCLLSAWLFRKASASTADR